MAVICRDCSAGVCIKNPDKAAPQGKQPELAIMGGLSHRAGGKSMLPELCGCAGDGWGVSSL